MSDVIASLNEDHVNLAKLLRAVERQLDLFDTGEAPDYDILRGVVDYCLNYPDLYHHPKEDLIYQRLRHRDRDAAALVGDLEAEHRSLTDLTRRFAGALHSVLRDAEVPREAFDGVAREFIERHRQHMRMEEEVFLPAAERSLTAEDWAAIGAKSAAYEDPVFGPAESEEHYVALRQELLIWAGEGG